MLAAGITALEYSLPITLVLMAAISGYSVSHYAPQQRVRLWLLNLVFCIAVLVSTTVIAAFWLDTTIDGQTYHTEAILSLSQDWNPYRSNSPDGAIFPQWTGF